MIRLLQTHRVFVVVLVLGWLIMAARPVTDPDLWWHLRTGELILQTRAIPHSDPFSFTRNGAPWIDHEWLPQIAMFLIYRATGWAGLIVTFAIVTAAAFVVVYLRSPGRPYVAGAIAAWGAVASIPSWGVRPQMLTLLLASILLLILEHSVDRPRLIWWIPPLILLWVNLHAGFALGLALIALFCAGEILDRTLGEGPNSKSHLPQLVSVLLVSIALVPLNPYGTRLYLYPFQTLHSRTMQVYIGEWFSPNFHDPKYLPTLLMMLAILIVPVLSPRRMRPRELLLLLATTFLALRSVRHIPIYMLVAVPLMSGMVSSRLKSTRAITLLQPSDPPLPLAKSVFNAAVLASVMAFCVVRLCYVIGRQATTEATAFPAAAVAFLEKDHPPEPIMNHYNWGGYFIWKLYPQNKVYIDGRADVYGDAFMDEFAYAYYLKGRSWPIALNHWNIETVVLPPDAPLITALSGSSGWKTLFRDEQAVVLSKEPRMARESPIQP